MKNTIPRSTVSDFLGNIPATPELTQQKSKAAVSQEDPGPAAKPSELESQSCREEPASNDFKSSARTGAPAKRAGWEKERFCGPWEADNTVRIPERVCFANQASRR